MGDFYLAHEYLFASAQLILAMLGLGATLRIGDFEDIVREPRAIGLGLIVQLLVVPALAFFVGQAFALRPGVAIGLILVSAVPGGTMSNVLTHFARGHVPLSISLTAVTTLGSLVTTPLILGTLAGSYLPDDVRMPVGRIALEIGGCLLGPLGLGMWIGHRFPETRDVFSRWCIRASVGTIVLIVIGAAAADRLGDASFGGDGAAIASFTMVSCALGFGVARIAHLRPDETVAIGIEASFRNSGLALLVKASVFPAVAGVANPLADDVLFTVLVYAGVAFQVALVPLIWHRRVAGRAAGSE